MPNIVKDGVAKAEHNWPRWSLTMKGEPLAPNKAVRRDGTRGSSPTVSVVIASNESEDELESCISSLRTRFDPSHTEYVVAWSGAGHAGADLKRRLPFVHFI